jgi:type II secretory pathway component GspD/PulD (secretin)
MNELKERYVETALDELYNGGPAPDLEQRILLHAPPRAAAGIRWRLVSAACAVVALGVVGLLMLPQPDVPPTVSLEPEDATEQEVDPQRNQPEPVPADPTDPDVVGEPNGDENRPDPEAPISIRLANTEIRVVMKKISELSGIKIVVEGTREENITAWTPSSRPRDLVRSICVFYGLDFLASDDELRVIVPDSANVAKLNAARSALDVALAYIKTLSGTRERAERRNDTESVTKLDRKIADQQSRADELRKEIAQHEVAVEAENNADPDDPITIDFVQKDLHTVMHYIALRSGLQIIVEGDFVLKLTVMFRNVDPKEALRSICKANNLEMVENGIVIIVKRNPEWPIDVDFGDVSLGDALTDIYNKSGLWVRNRIPNEQALLVSIKCAETKPREIVELICAAADLQLLDRGGSLSIRLRPANMSKADLEQEIADEEVEVKNLETSLASIDSETQRKVDAAEQAGDSVQADEARLMGATQKETIQLQLDELRTDVNELRVELLQRK